MQRSGHPGNEDFYPGTDIPRPACPEPLPNLGGSFTELSANENGARLLIEKGYTMRVVSHSRCGGCGFEAIRAPEILVGDESVELCPDCFGRNTFMEHRFEVWDEPEKEC